MENEKRLTEKHYSGKGYYLKCSGDCPSDGNCDECDNLYEAIDRLGEFEDKAEQTVDAVEVVRCKDCKRCAVEHNHVTLQYQHFCTHRKGFPEVSADDFCSYGERKDNG